MSRFRMCVALVVVVKLFGGRAVFIDSKTIYFLGNYDKMI